MVPSFVITFRETLEAALVVGIVLSYLARTGQTKYAPVVYAGIASGIVASIIGALAFTTIAGGFEGRAEEIFEGIVMLVGAILLTTMILWMRNQRHIAAHLEQKVASELSETHRLGLFLLVFVAILREGIETIIFLSAARFALGGDSLPGALAGILTAGLIGYAIFVGSMKVNLRKFFTVTGILLVLFAAGLVAQGIHELQEARLVPAIVEHIWDINPPVGSGGVYPLLHERGYLGSILVGLFGYNGNPSLLEVLIWLGYLTIVLLLWRKLAKVQR